MRCHTCAPRRRHPRLAGRGHGRKYHLFGRSDHGGGVGAKQKDWHESVGLTQGNSFCLRSLSGGKAAEDFRRSPISRKFFCVLGEGRMISVYALLCAASVAGSDCSVENAIDVIRMPDAENELNCLEGTMMTLAQLAIQPGAGEYWKVICKPPGQIDVDVARRHHATHHHRG
jgi:hypothetical protein